MKSLITPAGLALFQELQGAGAVLALQERPKPFETIRTEAVLFVAQSGHSVEIPASPEERARFNCMGIVLTRADLERVLHSTDDNYPLNTIIQKLLAAGFLHLQGEEDCQHEEARAKKSVAPIEPGKKPLVTGDEKPRTLPVCPKFVGERFHQDMLSHLRTLTLGAVVVRADFDTCCDLDDSKKSLWLKAMASQAFLTHNGKPSRASAYIYARKV